MRHIPLQTLALIVVAATLAVGAAPSFAISNEAKAAAVGGAIALRKPIAKAVGKAFETPLPAASQAQLDAAERVYYGLYECEFNQAVDIGINPKYPAYVDVRHGKQLFVMKPVLSSTGAVRLEDVRGVMLMVQITSKSMLMDVKSGRRVADECVSDKHREAIQATVGAPAAQSLMSPPAEAPPSVPSSTSPNVPEPPPPGPSPAPHR